VALATRYVSRPPVAIERLDLTAQGQVRYRLKTPYRDGTTYIVSLIVRGLKGMLIL
jgi:Putative transposase